METKALISVDPGTTLAGAKAFLKIHGFDQNLGDPDAVKKFDDFSNISREYNTYAGKSLKLGEGGRAAMLKHKLIVSGKFGKTLDDVGPEQWKKINDISRINYMNKYGPNSEHPFVKNSTG